MTDVLMKWAVGLLHQGVPFKEHGRSLDGVDCWGLVWLAYKECFGIDLPSYNEDYIGVKTGDDFKHLAGLIESHKSEWDEVLVERPGDVVLLRLIGRPIHVGLVIQPGIMLHIEHGINICVEKYGSTAWKNRVLGFYRYRPV